MAGQMRGSKKKAAASSKAASLPVRVKDDEPLETPQPSKGNMVVFGDDSDDAVVVSQTKTVVEKPVAPKPEEIEEDSDDDDDEAPEAVTTTQTTSKAEKLAQGAQKAAQEQAATQKRKRQERDALFKQQAGDRKKVEEEEKKALTTAAKADESDGDAEIAPGQPTIGRRRNRLQIPSTLPVEFLTDSSSEDEDEEMSEAAYSQPKKRRVADVEKRLTRLDRGPLDETVGSTVYRVASVTDQRLAPKSMKYSQRGKDVLLRRNRTTVKPRAGFFKNIVSKK